MKYQLKCAVWETTLKCNLNCSHCGSSAGKARENELTTKECLNLCEQLAELGCENVALMGGEPFMRKDWFLLGECIKDLVMGLNIVSNGLVLGKHINKISQLKPQVVGISLDGLKETHDKIRNKGSFRAALNSIDLLRTKGIQTTVITTVSKINFNDLNKMKDLIGKKGVNWQIQVAMPFGNFDRKFMLSKEEFYAAALFIANLRIKTKFDDFLVVGAHCFGYYSKLLPGCGKWKGCTAGISSIGITSDGGIVGCLSLGNNRFIEGNVREESPEEIWEDGNRFGFTRGFDVDDLGENCKGCKFGAECKGGCSSMSYTITDRFHNDPYCFYKIERDD